MAGCEEGPGICALIMTLGSLFLIVVSLPLSLMFVVKVVQEYERAVIFRLGRLRHGGAKGPGIFFILPCIDHYKKVDPVHCLSTLSKLLSTAFTLSTYLHHLQYLRICRWTCGRSASTCRPRRS